MFSTCCVRLCCDFTRIHAILITVTIGVRVGVWILIGTSLWNAWNIWNVNAWDWRTWNIVVGGSVSELSTLRWCHWVGTVMGF